jgi:hypothetical protein
VMRDHLLTVLSRRSIGPQSYSEASTGAFYWARKFEALGYQVKLRSPRTKRGESRVPLRGKRIALSSTRYGSGVLFSAKRRFETSRPSQRVRSLGVLFPGGGESPTFPQVRLGSPVSGPQFLAFRLLRGGFLAPVSGGDFPISVSGVQRPVRLLTETGSRSAFGYRARRRCGVHSLGGQAIALPRSAW